MRYLNLLKNLSNWWLYLAVKFGIVTTDPLLFRTRKGVLIGVPRRLLQTFKEIFMEECYLRGRKFSFRANPVVIDIGANAGFFTLFALSEWPGVRVFSYEPIPVNFRQLQNNLNLNPGLPAVCFQQAVVGHSGVVSLSYDDRDEFTTAATIYDRGGDLATVKVAGTSLADIFQKNDLTTCDLLKMDCEGAEYQIIYECPAEILARIRNMAMEVHEGQGPGRDIDSLDAYLRARGYDTRRRPVGMLWAWQMVK